MKLYTQRCVSCRNVRNRGKKKPYEKNRNKRRRHDNRNKRKREISNTQDLINNVNKKAREKI